jgi:4-amino-4-deoxy-L-arabinose transferase-like glycosyltransferase
MSSIQYKIGQTFAILAMLYVAFLQFYNLSKLPIIQWDESRLAVNAAEMHINQSFLVTTYNNQPDLWNTKPPLMIWLQSLSMALFGINEWAVRFPSALSGYVCILFLGFWMYKISKSYYWSGLSMLLLAVSGGFIQLHGSMTGDYDALLSLFVLLSVYHYSKFYFESKETSLIWMMACVALAIMTKSAAAFIMFPLFFVIPMLQRKWRIVFKLGIGLFIAILPFVVFCVLRENSNSGYIKQMWQNDFGGRFNEVIEGHEHSWYYYIENLAFERMNYFVIFLIPAIIWFVYKKDLKISFLSMFVCGFVLILSISKTKINWYDMPILSIVSLIIMVFIWQNVLILKNIKIKMAFSLMIFAAMIPNIYTKFNFIAYHENLQLSFDHYELSEYLRTYKKKEALNYISLNYDAEYYFYTKQNSLISRGIIGEMKVGEKVVLQNFLESELALVYQYDVLEIYKGVKCVRIIGIN